jgi:hypothetical protein
MAHYDKSPRPPPEASMLWQLAETLLGIRLSTLRVDPKLLERLEQNNHQTFDSRPLGVERAEARFRDMQMQAELRARALTQELARQTPSTPSEGAASTADVPLTKYEAVRVVYARPDYASLHREQRRAAVAQLCGVPVDARGFSLKQLGRAFGKLK